MLPTIYNYHPITGEFLSEGLADESPVEGDGWLIPAHATSIEPPTIAVDQVAIFDGKAWMLRYDSRAVNARILAVPNKLFGGPTLQEIFHGRTAGN